MEVVLVTSHMNSLVAGYIVVFCFGFQNKTCLALIYVLFRRNNDRKIRLTRHQIFCFLLMPIVIKTFSVTRFHSHCDPLK